MASPPPVARQVSAGIRTLLVLTVLLGLAYPLAMTSVAQLFFPEQADGSIVEVDGEAMGSELVGQSFDGDQAYFQSRPSAAGDGYDPLSTSASNYGAENEAYVALVEERRAAVADFEGVPEDEVPQDAVQASGSGLDPHISTAYAELQVPRVASKRGLDEDVVRGLVKAHTDGRGLGFLGAPGVNVLMLNIALDRATEGAD